MQLEAELKSIVAENILSATDYLAKDEEERRKMITHDTIILPEDYGTFDLINLACIIRNLEQRFKIEILNFNPKKNIELLEKLKTFNELYGYVRSLI